MHAGGAVILGHLTRLPNHLFNSAPFAAMPVPHLGAGRTTSWMMYDGALFMRALGGVREPLDVDHRRADVFS